MIAQAIALLAVAWFTILVAWCIVVTVSSRSRRR